MDKIVDKYIEDLTNLGVTTNPLSSLKVATYLIEADSIRNLLQDYDRISIYKLYPYEYQLLSASCKMVAKSIQLAINSDISLSRIIDPIRLESPMIKIPIEVGDGWDWITDDFISFDKLYTSDIAMDCFTSEWITKLGKESLAEHYSKYGNEIASEYLLTELWESLLYYQLAKNTTNIKLKFSIMIAVYSKYAMLSLIDSDLSLFSCTSDVLIPLATERFKEGINQIEYENLINKANKIYGENN